MKSADVKKPTMFTDNFLRGLKSSDKQQQEYFEDSGTRGMGRLGVRVNRGHVKVFFFRYQFDGKRQFINIGVFGSECSLKQARDIAHEYGQKVKAGLDPKVINQQIAEDKLAKEAENEKMNSGGTLRELFEGYRQFMIKRGKRTHEAMFKSLVKEVFPIIPETKKAKDVTREDILNVLATMLGRGAKTQSNRVRSYLNAAFNYGREYDSSPDKIIEFGRTPVFNIQSNPVDFIRKQDERVGKRYLSKLELGVFLNTFNKTPKVGLYPELLLKLMIFMGGQRGYELSICRWKSVDFNEGVFTIPDHITKNGRELQLPIFGPIKDLLLQIKSLTYPSGKGLTYAEAGEYCMFPQAGKPLVPMHQSTLSKCVRRFVIHNNWINSFCVRDIRRTCKTLGGEAGMLKDHRDRIQNHAFNDVSSIHYDGYQYLPEKRESLILWHAYIDDAIKSASNPEQLSRHRELNGETFV